MILGTVNNSSFLYPWNRSFVTEGRPWWRYLKVQYPYIVTCLPAGYRSGVVRLLSDNIFFFLFSVGWRWTSKWGPCTVRGQTATPTHVRVRPACCPWQSATAPAHQQQQASSFCFLSAPYIHGPWFLSAFVWRTALWWCGALTERDQEFGDRECVCQALATCTPAVP